MKPPRKGDRVVVVARTEDGPRVWRTIVAHRGKRKRTLTPQIGPLVLQFADEGVTWARGWTTPEALALRAEIALENSR